MGALRQLAAGVIVATGLVACFSGQQSLIRRAENYAKRLTANGIFWTFPVPLANEEVGLVVFDSRTADWYTLRPEGSHLAVPYISNDGSLYISGGVPPDEGRWATSVLKCVPPFERCEQVQTQDRPVGLVRPLDDGGLLFASSTSIDTRTGFQTADFDFFRYYPTGGTDRLTDYKFWSLGRFDVSGTKVLFSGTAPRRSTAAGGSQLYWFELPTERRVSTTLNRLDHGVATDEAYHPGASGDLLAFNELDKSGGRWRFQIKVVRQGTPPTVLTTVDGGQFGTSNPVLIGSEVRYLIFDGQDYAIMSKSAEGGESRLIGRVPSREVARRARSIQVGH